jgi:glycosyltransferase involved in cell wall biosynthesis
VPELVTDETGILVPSQDNEAVADAVIGLLADPKKRNTMGQNGRQRVIDEFSQESMVKAREQLFIELLSIKGR